MLTYIAGLKSILISGLIFCFLPSFQLPTSDVTPIVLKPEANKIIASEFYIASIQDERPEKHAVAFLQVLDKTKKNLVQQPVDLQGGGLPALKKFITNTISINTSLRPVTVRLQECKISETTAGLNRIDGRIAVSMLFEIKRDGKILHTLEYKGGARYSRTLNQIHLIEPALRQSLRDALNYLNTWMNRESDRNVNLASGLNMHIRDVVGADEDTVFYQVTRPLTWQDFKGKMKITGPSAAAVFPGFSFDSRSEIKKGIIHVYLDIKVYMVKNNSWVKYGMDAYGLNHEQRHFDIVKIGAERFKKRIQPAFLTVETYEDALAREYFAALAEINKMQERYDSETRHSINVAIQESWNRRIDADLQALEVIK